MNHFLALAPDTATRDRLTLVVERLRAWGLPARWTHPDDYHVTLLFLGHLDEQEATAVGHAVEDAAQAGTPGPFRLVGLGATGGRIVPTVVYAAIEDPAGACADRASDLADALGMPAVRDFRPHLTLCRPSARPAATTRSWPELFAGFGQAAWGTCRLDGLGYYRAEATVPGLPRYRQLAFWPA